MKKKIIFLIAGIILLAIFAGFSKYVKAGNLKNIDFATTIRIQNHISSRFDEIMADGAVLADPIVSTVLVMLTAGIFFIKTKGKRKFLAVSIPVAFAIFTLLEIYGKNFVPHPGPPFFMVKHPTTIFPEFTVIQPYSYPSGHTARITFLGVLLLSFTIKMLGKPAISFIKKKPWLILGAMGIVVYIIFITISRIYLGQHWLSDIIGGLLLGSAFAVISVGLL